MTAHSLMASKSLSFLPATEAGTKVQPKLTIGTVNDPLEHEADAMASKVMSMQEVPAVTTSGPAAVQRKCAHCEDEEKLQRKPLASFIQRKESAAGVTAPDAVSNQINASRGSGSNMDSNTQSFMQNRFGTDFSEVKIHTGGEAIQMSRELNAKAFTVGRDIYFNEGQYNPTSNEGKHLLAHELTHTVQQGASNPNIQRAPFGHKDRIHDSLEDDFSKATGRPHEHHSQEYETWLQGRSDAVIAFDAHQLLPEHLKDVIVQNRLAAMTLEELYEYRTEYIGNGANNPVVVKRLTDIMLGRPVQACTKTESKDTEKKARAVMSNLSTVISNADKAMTLLHSAWINNKADLLSKKVKLTGEVACAFRSNFNIDETNPDFGVTQIKVMQRLQQFQRRLKRPVSFTCEAINNPICISGAGLDAAAYVVNHQDPIHLCMGFREAFFSNIEEAIIIHEFMHLLPGVDDAGGYASGGFGTIVMTCKTGAKFSAAANILANTADSLAGFVMHIDQTSATDLMVK